MTHYCALIPAYQAEATIGMLVRAVRSLGLAVAVIDDGSCDRTAAQAASHGAVVLRHARNTGKGCALRTGFAHAVREGFDGVLTMDADGQHDPRDVPALLETAAKRPDAIIIGDRMHAPGRMPVDRWWANLMASAVVSAVSGQRIRDSQSGFRVIPRDVLEHTPLQACRYDLETELLLAAAAGGTRILSVPVRSIYAGQASQMRRWRDPMWFCRVVGRHLMNRSKGPRPPFGQLNGVQADASSKRRVLVFLKEPVPGRVKTRLAATIGHQDAAALYRACAEETLRRLEPLVPETTVYVDPPDAIGRIREWVGPAWTLRSQHGATLGRRLSSAFSEAFSAGATHVVVIGTDSPWLSAADIERAFAAMKDVDVVIGPSEDGGYYLLGLAKPLPEVFDGIPWSTPDVYASTLARAQTLGLRVGAIRMGYDVDQWNDVERWMADRRPEASISSPRQPLITTQRRSICPS
ncbi:MAG: TIGR04282 family arsenosugar biosynthesis glycosyltransferase [Candidatus Omnitrophica bacterium]|nr:TIGR04282 family arsenosugar biosynthesis glycosyltransferase [Candidatus Omnitrophota bacterium]